MKLFEHENGRKFAMDLTLKFIDYDSNSLDNPKFATGETTTFTQDGYVVSCEYPAGMFDEDVEIQEIRDYTLKHGEVLKPS